MGTREHGRVEGKKQENCGRLLWMTPTAEWSNGC